MSERGERIRKQRAWANAFAERSEADA